MTGNKTETLKEGYNTYYPKKQTTISMFFDEYPYKKRTCPTCLPYVALDEDTDELYSLTYDEWKEILYSYFKHLCHYLLSGNVYRFSSHIGEFQIQKYKSRKKNLNIDQGAIIKHYMEQEDLDWNEAKEYVKSLEDPMLFKHKNRHILGYKWSIIWFKKEYRLAFKHHWTFRFSRAGMWRYIESLFKEDRSLIHNIIESRFSKL